MSVRVAQDNDGTRSGAEVIVPAHAGWTDQQLIDWKRDEHEADGWAIQVKQAGRRVTCTKGYSESERAKDPALPAQVVRTFRVVS